MTTLIIDGNASQDVSKSLFFADLLIHKVLGSTGKVLVDHMPEELNNRLTLRIPGFKSTVKIKQFVEGYRELSDALSHFNLQFSFTED